MSTLHLEKIFSPKRIAVIGAGEDGEVSHSAGKQHPCGSFSCGKGSGWNSDALRLRVEEG